MDHAETFSALHNAANAACGARLFTVTVLDRGEGLAWRAFSSHPDEYPVTGTKTISENAWTRQVLDRGEVFVANCTAAFAPYFSDYAIINALGCSAAVNIPVADGSQVQGTVNILDKEGHFTPERVAILEDLVAETREDLLSAFKAALERKDP